MHKARIMQLYRSYPHSVFIRTAIFICSKYIVNTNQ